MNPKIICRIVLVGASLALSCLAAPSNLTVTTIVSSTAANYFSYSMSGPEGIAVDASGNLYVADPINNVVEKLSPTGVLKILAGQSGVIGSTDGPGTAASFNGPTGIVVDAGGNVYVADQQNCTIRKITSAGVVSTLAGTTNVSGHQDGPGKSATLSQPTALAIDAAGNIYVADGANGNVGLPNSPGISIREISSAGVVSTVSWLDAIAALSPAPFNLQGIAIDGQGNLFVSVGALDNYLGAISDVFAPNGDTIFKVSHSGVVSLYAGQMNVRGATDGPAAQAQFSNPGGLSTDSAGNLYVADSDNLTIREISPSGVVTTIAGAAGNLAGINDGSGSQVRFYGPESVAVDASGNVFIADGLSVRRGVPSANTEGPIRFVNLSARGTVGPSSPLIGGFAVEGTVSQTVLARGVGPSLTQFGVTNALGSAQLDIYDQTGTLVASSSAGTNATNSSSAGALAGAFPLPANSGDAALVITLKPGAYTAVVSSPTGASGTALVEVYEVP